MVIEAISDRFFTLMTKPWLGRAENAPGPGGLPQPSAVVVAEQPKTAPGAGGKQKETDPDAKAPNANLQIPANYLGVTFSNKFKSFL